LLRIINSPVFRLLMPVKSVDRAVGYPGDSQMALLVISPGLKPVLPLQLHEETCTLPVNLPSVIES
jgi:hypothetical protein